MARSTDVPAFAARIHKEAQRMIALVSDILQLSELDSTQAARGQQNRRRWTWPPCSKK